MHASSYASDQHGPFGTDALRQSSRQRIWLQARTWYKPSMPIRIAPSKVAGLWPVLGAALLLAYAGFASGLQARSTAVALAVLIPVAVVAALAMRRDRSIEHEEPPTTPRAVRLWSVLFALGLLWEAWAFFHQPAWDVAAYDYPSLSSLVKPYLEHRAVAFGAWMLWLYAGVRLVRP